MLAEQHGVIAGNFRAEAAVAMVAPVAVAVRHVELPLHIAAIAGGTGIIAVRTEEVIRDVLDGIQAQAVRLGGGHDPAHIPAQVGAHVFGKETGILGDEVGGQPVVRAEADIEVGIGVPAPVPGIPKRLGHVGVRHAVIELGIVRMSHETGFGIIIPLVQTEVVVGRFVGDVDQVGKSQVLHLPGARPVPAVVPFPVEAVLGHAEMEILRQHAGIHIHRGAFIVTGDIERPVVHDVVQIDPDAEPVGHFDQIQQFGFRAVPGGHRTPLVPPAEIKGIK